MMVGSAILRDRVFQEVRVSEIFLTRQMHFSEVRLQMLVVSM